MLRIFGSCRTFYEIHSTRGLCVLGSKEGYANYLSSEVVPALREEFPSQTLDEESYICERLENAHFYDNGQLLLSENPQIIKITTQSLDQQKLEQLTNSLHTQVPHFAVSHQSPYRLDITAVNALKGAAVHFYTEKYQISLKDTMVIGDSENDYSMLGLPYIESRVSYADPRGQTPCSPHFTGRHGRGRFPGRAGRSRGGLRRHGVHDLYKLLKSSFRWILFSCPARY